MKSNVWLTISWLDYQLKWDPREYDGIKVPNLTGFNTLSEQFYTFWLGHIYIKCLCSQCLDSQIASWQGVAARYCAFKQRRWQLWSHVQGKHQYRKEWVSKMDSSCDLSVYMSDWCSLFSIWSTNVCHEICFLDIHRKRGTTSTNLYQIFFHWFGYSSYIW